MHSSNSLIIRRNIISALVISFFFCSQANALAADVEPFAAADASAATTITIQFE